MQEWIPPEKPTGPRLRLPHDPDLVKLCLERYIVLQIKARYVTLKSETRELVDEWAASKNSFRSMEALQTELRHWSRLTGEDSVGSACEVGCGSGVFLAAAYASGWIEYSAVGIDALIESAGTADSELRNTQEFLEDTEMGDSVSLEHGVFPDEMPDGVFDLLIFRNVLHHIYKSNEGTLKDCIRELRAAQGSITDEGYIYIVEPTIPIWPKRVAIDLFRTKVQKTGTMAWEEKRTVKEWVEVLEAAGYEDVRTTTLPTGMFLDNKMPSLLDQVISFEHLITAHPTSE